VKARDVVGRKIVGIRQSKVWNEDERKFEISLEAIQLDNGTSILMTVHEVPHDYTIHAWVHRRGQ
jgi:hypothetical protein